jgi:predicted RNase H-like HicB family nuclease
VIEYTILIEPNEDGSGFSAYAPDLPGCGATGGTPEEARERLAFSIPLHIESLKAHGEPVPAPRVMVDRVSVAA